MFIYYFLNRAICAAQKLQYLINNRLTIAGVEFGPFGFHRGTFFLFSPFSFTESFSSSIDRKIIK